MAGNSKLSERLTPLLPAGTSMQAAAQGFQNQGQFIAALHASRNLNIAFTDLKGRMTGDKQVSLGEAIRELRPDLERSAIDENVKRAEREAKEDMRNAK